LEQHCCSKASQRSRKTKLFLKTFKHIIVIPTADVKYFLIQRLGASDSFGEGQSPVVLWPAKNPQIRQRTVYSPETAQQQEKSAREKPERL